MRNLPHLTYLQAFGAAARHLSFTRASEELNCTQAAISQRIRGLEQHFGRPLFHRKPNGLELSSAGAAYLPGIAQALDVMDAATRGLTGRQVAQTVTVSGPISFLNHCLASMLSDFTLTHPDIGLRLNSSIWTDPNVDLADLSIEITEASLMPPGATLLAPAPVSRVSSPLLNPLAARRIEVQGKFPLWDLWSEAAHEEFDATLPPCRVDTAATALHLVQQGLGHAVIYSIYAQQLWNEGYIEATLPADIDHVLILRRNPARRIPRAATLFIEWLEDRMRSQ